jgi:hypothetical protein
MAAACANLPATASRRWCGDCCGRAVQRVSPTELADLAREFKRYGQDIRDGRLSMQALRGQIARGDRGDRLFCEDRTKSGGGNSAIKAEKVAHVVTDWIDRIG